MTGRLSPILIGIVGKLGVGKSTLAEMLAAEIPDARVIAFADALKEDVHNWVEHYMDRSLTTAEITDLKSTCLGPMYQGWGELMRRLVGDDFWVAALEASLPARAIVADVRYPNEAAWIKSRGGLLVAISGPCRREGDQRSTEHPSEAHVPEIARGADVAIVNDWTLDGLGNEAHAIAAMAMRLAEGRAQ